MGGGGQAEKREQETGNKREELEVWETAKGGEEETGGTAFQREKVKAKDAHIMVRT